MSCTTLAIGIQASCTAVKRPGGIDKRVYLALLDDLKSITFGTGNIILAFVFKPGKGFSQWTGRKEKNSAGSEIEIGDNFTVRTHTVAIEVYWETAAQLTALDDLLDADSVFAGIETNAATIEFYGVNNSGSFNNFGLKATKNSGKTGKVLNDGTSFSLELSGGHQNLQLLYNPTLDVATNVLKLNLQSVDPIGS